MKASKALLMLRQVQESIRVGIRDVWLQRNKARSDWVKAHKLTVWQRRNAALLQLLQRYKQRDLQVPSDLRQHVENMRGRRLKKWLEQ